MSDSLRQDLGHKTHRMNRLGRRFLGANLAVLGVPLHQTVGLGEEGVVAAHADVAARVHAGTALAG